MEKVVLRSLRRAGLPVLVAAALTTGCASDLRYEPDIYSFYGSLRAERYYGPPNYGETPGQDRVETALVLDLDAPISVAPRLGDELNKGRHIGLKRAQLVGAGVAEAFGLVGEDVVVEGVLSEAISGHHHTDVVI